MVPSVERQQMDEGREEVFVAQLAQSVPRCREEMDDRQVLIVQLDDSGRGAFEREARVECR